MIRLSKLITEAVAPKFEPIKLKHKFKDYAPAFDEETMKTHYGKHYQGYIDKLNEAVKEENIPVVMGERMSGIKTILNSVSQYSMKLRNNAGGFYNHTLFFNGLNPEMKGKLAEGEVEDALTRQYGSIDKFKSVFKEKALGHFGSGWCWLLHHNGQFNIVTTDNQDNPLMDVVYAPGDILIALDLWEHSYYLKYKNDRAKYIDAFFKLLCWSMTNERYMVDQY
mgnify:CR=1 FL=1